MEGGVLSIIWRKNFHPNLPLFPGFGGGEGGGQVVGIFYATFRQISYGISPFSR